MPDWVFVLDIGTDRGEHIAAFFGLEALLQKHLDCQKLCWLKKLKATIEPLENHFPLR
jgi:hypothetical protein